MPMSRRSSIVRQGSTSGSTSCASNAAGTYRPIPIPQSHSATSTTSSPWLSASASGTLGFAGERGGEDEVIAIVGRDRAPGFWEALGRFRGGAVAAVIAVVLGLAGLGGRNDGDAARVREVGGERDGTRQADVGEAAAKGTVSAGGVRRSRPWNVGVRRVRVDRDIWRSLEARLTFFSLSASAFSVRLWKMEYSRSVFSF
jgi:hypothetical protein